MTIILDGTNGISDVDGSASTPAIRGTDANTGLFFGTDTVGVSTGGSERMRVDASGNVGIGTTSIPAASLTLSNTRLLAWTNSSNAFAGGTAGSAIFKFSDNNLYIDSFDSSAIIFRRNSYAESMRILSSGNLVVGTSGDLNSRYKVQVANTSLGGFFGGATGSGDGNFVSVSTTIGYHFYAESTTARFYVVNNGTIHSTSTSITAISDARHKENVKDLETGLSEIMALKPRRFDWKQGKGTGEKNVAGFIAQEVEDVLPDLIGEWKEELSTDTTFKSLAMGNMIPTLVKAIQELNAKVEEQAARIAELEGAK